MSIFTEIHELRTFESLANYREFLNRLQYALEKEWIEEVPVMVKRPIPSDERWFRDKDTGDVYMLEVPEPPGTGTWRPVEAKELSPG